MNDVHATTLPAVQGIRLSPHQRRLWAMQAGGRTLNARLVVQLEGPLVHERLAAAVSDVVARHEIFRTTFRGDARLKFPLQVINEVAVASWRVVDLRSLAAAEIQARIEQMWQQAGHAAVTAERGSLLDLTLIQSGDRLHVLLVTVPALCADLATLHLFVDELARSYRQGANRGGSDEVVHYAQFAEWQNEMFDEAKAEVFADRMPPTLPFESRDQSGPSRFGTLTFSLGASMCQGLERVARSHGVDLKTVLLASWQVYLARLGGKSHFMLAWRADQRLDEEVAQVRGHVSTWLPLPCRIEGREPFDRALQYVQQSLAAVAHRDSEMAECWLAPRDHGVGDVGFSFDVLPAASTFDGLTWRVEAQELNDAGFKLNLAVCQGYRDLSLSLTYDQSRIAASGAAVIADQMQALLTDLGRESRQNADDFVLAGANEQARLLAWASPGAALQQAEPLHRAFERAAVLHATDLAVVCGTQTLTHRQLNERANQLAHRLRQHKVGADTPVGLYAQRSVDTIVGLLGILKAGGAYVPLDPLAPPERLREQCELAGLRVMVSQLEHCPVPEGCVIQSLSDPTLVEERNTRPDVEVNPAHLASVIFTSGSTGKPKGVAITHRGMSHYTASLCQTLNLGSGLHFATVSTLSADLGNTSIFAALASGGCLHVIDYTVATDGRRFADYCAIWPLDVLKIVPSHLNALLDAGGGASILPRRLLVLGGETLSLALVERIAALGASCAVANHYGPTETTVGSLTLPLTQWLDHHGCLSVPIGRPFAHAQAYVLDGHARLAAIGTIGELYLGGTAVARGYLGRPDLTAERFVPHPFRAGERLYRTGDRVRVRPDGTIEFIGRVDHQLKIRGFRVELGEIEAKLRDYPAIKQAIVVANVEGSGQPALLAYVVLRDPSLDRALLLDFLKQRLPDYMVPVEYMIMESLPLTANGKVDRQALPQPRTRRELQSVVEPRNPLEQQLAAIWRDVLGVAALGVTDDFFALGGHSLLAIPLTHRISRELNVELSLLAIFQAPTIAQLAVWISSKQAQANVHVLRPGDPQSALFCVDPTGRHATAYQALADALDGEQAVFGLDLGLILAKQGDRPVFADTVQHLANVVQERQPYGPYRLLGWSLGGALALGIARELEIRGHVVAFLGILDTQPREHLYGQEQVDVVEELSHYVDTDRKSDLLALPTQDLDQLRQQMQGLASEARVERAIAWAQHRGFLAADAEPSAYVHRYALLRDTAVSLQTWPKPCVAAPIDVWWSSETLAASHPRVPVDWQIYTRSPVQVASIVGDHAAVLHASSVHLQVGAALSRCRL